MVDAMEAATDLAALIGRIPAVDDSCPPSRDNIQCCCGRTDCAYLRHNGSALDDLEKDVRTAAELGQALLVRHEAYMADAARDRQEMSTKIIQLESEKRVLERENAATVQENRGLLEQLEGLNTTLVESEAHIKALEATLRSTNQELRRLEILAARTHGLEMQLAALEKEQEVLQRTMHETEEDERSAIQRWKKAERHLTDLQDQLERIEREAREERERHVEVLGRMERQRAVERELDTAAGRLKGAAALTGNPRKGTDVVSHFVKDILQDNANLQLGIVELREMLMNSNDEVQSLREQLLLHQPLPHDDSGNGPPPTLKAELTPKEEPEAKVVSQALHIHHHYHAPKKEDVRRPKKKRAPIIASIFTPPRHMSPRMPSANAILSQTSVSIPAPTTPNNRWSMQSGQLSDFAPSSVPSSPQSMYRHSGLFDRGFDLESRPTSPGSSVDPTSPQFAAFRHRKRASEVSTRSFAPQANFQPNNVIEEEDADVELIRDLSTPSLEDDNTSNEYTSVEQDAEADWNHSRLRRSTSHESILSISGIDIHTLASRPSQITMTGRGLQPRSRQPTPISIDTLTSSSFVTATPTLSRQGHDSTYYLRSNITTSHRRSPSMSSGHSGSGGTTPEAGLGKKVGGWVFGRWGVSPASSPKMGHAHPSPNSLAVPKSPLSPTTRAGNARSASSTEGSGGKWLGVGEGRVGGEGRTVSSPVVDPLKAFMGRPPGINQKGPIPGYVKKVEKAPSQVLALNIDKDALKEVLLEGGMR